MKSIFINIVITEYGTKDLEPYCRYWECIDCGEMTRRKLTKEEACKLMWELKLAGGTRTISTNKYDPSISYCEVQYWARR